MSSADWEEVKRLAADFQRAQLTVGAQRLTERNCVEIVNKLLELKLLDIYFTLDGKEYVTPEHLGREIMDELYIHGGRLSLVELSVSLNVSIQVVTNRATELARHEKGLFLILGQLVTSGFLDSLAQDLNEKLVQDGMISLNELSKTSDLPGDFLHEQIIRRIGKIIHGKQDETEPSLIYTQTFVQRNTAKVRGVLSGIMRPTPVNQIMNKVPDLPEKLFFQIMDKLLRSKRIDGIVPSHTRNSYFIPTIFSRAQMNYVEKFMNGNGYVDLDAAGRLGISEPKSFVQKCFPNQSIVFLKTCCLGESLFTQVKESVEESLANPGWIDVSTLLPFSVTEIDVNVLLQELALNQNETLVVGSSILSRNLIESLKICFRGGMEDKANKDVESGRYAQMMAEVRAAERKIKTAELNATEGDGRSHKKEDRRKKAAGGKGGGGTQGRETKTKSTKKKYMAGKRHDDDFESEEEEKPYSASLSSSGATSKTQLVYMTIKEIQKQLEKEEVLQDSSPEVVEAISSRILPGLNEEYQAVAKRAYEAFVSEKMGKKSKEELLNRAKKLMCFMRLYTEGLEEFDNKDTKSAMEKYLIKNFGQDVLVGVSDFLLQEAGIEDGSLVDLEDRTLVNGLQNLHKSATAIAFIEDLESLLGIRIEKDFRDIVLGDERQSLESQLQSAKNEENYAVFLHVFVLLVFALSTKRLLSASGKFVPQIIQLLTEKKILAGEELIKVKKAQDWVTSHYGKNKGKSGGSGDAEDCSEIFGSLLDVIECVKSKYSK